jgi:hypothetical protein
MAWNPLCASFVVRQTLFDSSRVGTSISPVVPSAHKRMRNQLGPESRLTERAKGSAPAAAPAEGIRSALLARARLKTLFGVHGTRVPATAAPVRFGIDRCLGEEGTLRRSMLRPG